MSLTDYGEILRAIQLFHERGAIVEVRYRYSKTNGSEPHHGSATLSRPSVRPITPPRCPSGRM